MCAVSILLVLGFGAAYVLAGAASSKQSVRITICHSGNGKKFTKISPDNVGVLLGHAKNHSDDIIPPFVVVNEKGTEVSFPGQNMEKIHGDGYTGAEVLANGCDIPSGSVITQTETTETTTTVPVTVTTPTTTTTLPSQTTRAEVTVTVTVPGETTTTPGTTTVVIPSEVTTTVTLPPRTTTLPAVTRTLPGQTIERPAETVTLPGTTVTVTAAGTTTVVTVTGPNKTSRW